MVDDYMKALNRKEVLVNAKANGTLDSFKPLTRDEAFTKKALGLGGGASSWNDLTDKPFYEDVDEGVIYAGENVEFSAAGGQYKMLPTDSYTTPIVVGGVYTVIWDGVEYSDLVAFDDGGYATLGATYNNTTEAMPFTFCMEESDGVSVLACYTLVSDEVHTYHSFSIVGVIRTIKPLEPMFSNVFRINVESPDDGQTYTCDRTYAEILNAIDTGYMVYATLYNQRFYCVEGFADECRFTNIMVDPAFNEVTTSTLLFDNSTGSLNITLTSRPVIMLGA